MRVLLYTEGLKKIGKSGLGKAVKHQIRALEDNGIEYSLNPKDIDKKYGVGTYYYHKQALPLARKIQDNLLAATGFRDDNVNFASFVMTRPTMPVSVLIECGYIIRKQEAEKISNPKFQKIIAKAITKGVEDYLKESFR